ncbi:MAG: TRAP transporter large permease, partial [Desulfobacterales bacterium]|nr:TRAP transporter large permease [Desulfobacterales bacterium]
MDLWVIVSLVITFSLMLLGVEIFVCLGIGTILMSILTGSFPLANLGLTSFTALDVFPLLALPLYILTGDLISEGGISQILVEFARSCVGWLRGGLAITTMWAAEGFAAISGSNSATVAAIGKIMVPELEKDGYPRDFSAGTVAACGTVGIITPPSIVFILYGVTAGISVGDLFFGGILTGLLMIICLSCTALMVCWYRGIGSTRQFSLSGLLRSAWNAKLPFGATAIILGGIYGGVFTPTEAAAVAVAYCLFGGLVVTRKLKVKKLPRVMESSAEVGGMIAPIIAMAVVFSEIMAVARLPEIGAKFLLGLSDSPII